jgi:hypothetical protein
VTSRCRDADIFVIVKRATEQRLQRAPRWQRKFAGPLNREVLHGLVPPSLSLQASEANLQSLVKRAYFVKPRCFRRPSMAGGAPRQVS